MSTPIAEVTEKILNGVEQRWHFSLTDNILDYTPNNDDILAAVYDSADDINGFAPNTLFSLVDIYDNPDPRWKSLLYLGAAKNVTQMVLNLWTQNGFDATIGDLSAPNKLGDYKSLYDTLTSEFEKKAERLKKTSQKFIRGIKPDSTSVNYLYGFSPFIQIFNSRIRLR